ncbi:YoaK family protein [Pseudonocardia xishanensis]|uniref:YoaK family protein n=1 Tax=Pseudonocardia xishanensis TaxID=630995 RepID=A0ABP8RXW4_9PSEU
MPDRRWWHLAEPRHGSLPLLLLLLTFVTGVIDAVSLLALGRIFVANMTGNVVVTGFALAGVPEFSLLTSFVALGGFLVGAAAGGFLVDRLTTRGPLLRAAVGVEWVLLACCLTLVVLSPPTTDSGPTVAAVALAALAMGVQNAVARRIAVPDLNTSVISMSMTGLAADHRHSTRVAAVRRLCAVTTLLLGATVGAVIVRTAGPAAALGLILALLAAVGLGAHLLLRRGPDWEE